MNRVQAGTLAATFGMEVCWLFAAVGLASIIAAQDGPVLSFIGVFLVVACAYGVAWLSNRLEWPMMALQGASALVGAIVITGVAQVHVLGPAGFLPVNFLWFMSTFGGQLTLEAQTSAGIAVIAGLVLWWRGVRVAQREAGFEFAVWTFRIGLGVVCIEALVEAVAAPHRSAAWVAIPFFTFGLMGLSLAHLEEVEREAWVGTARRWLWMPPLVIAGIALIAATVGFGLYESVWQLVRLVIGTFDRWIIEPILYTVLLGLGYLAEFLVNAILAMLKALGVRGNVVQLTTLAEMLAEIKDKPEGQSPWMHIIGQIIFGTLLALVVLGVFLWLARALGRRRQRARRLGNEERESIWAEGAFGEEMADLASRLFDRFRRRGGGIFLDELGNDSRGILLRLYFMLLRLAMQRGPSRAVWQTPAEFQSALAVAFPGEEQRVARLTDGFVIARYSRAMPPLQLAETAQQDWEALNRPKPAAGAS